MISKTPNFDRALDEYFSKLELDEKGGQWRVCRFSGEKFYVRPEDIEFYKRIRVPLPTLSPHERIRRKLAFWNSYNLFYSTSSFSGKKILSHYPADTPYKLYEHKIWFGEEWEPLNYGREFNFSKVFFDQFKELQLEVPRPALYVDDTSINSDYTNSSAHLKKCYLVFNSYEAEDSLYSISLLRSKTCVDSFDTFNSDICYECFESRRLYDCFFVEFSKDCLDSYFLYDCRNCSNCFGGVNLRHKKYVFFNERLTKEEYEERVRNINLGDRAVLKFYKDKFAALKRNAIHKPNHNERAVNSFGDYILRSRNCYHCLFVEDSEEMAYSFGLKCKNCYDSWGSDTELAYEMSGAARGFKILFSRYTEDCHDIEYSDLLYNCRDCFGCIGLSDKSFCIFNKQYSENEYWGLVDKIKTKMLKDGEYGEFFPPELSPWPYNISIATSYKGYDDVEVARKHGYIVKEVPETLYEITGDVIEAENLPADIKEVRNGILSKTIIDSKNNKKFRYVEVELDFYRKYNFPLPQEHFSVRLAEKRKRFGNIRLSFYERACPKCGITFQTIYSPDDERIVYCEPCYLQAVV